MPPAGTDQSKRKQLAQAAFGANPHAMLPGLCEPDLTQPNQRHTYQAPTCTVDLLNRQSGLACEPVRVEHLSTLYAKLRKPLAPAVDVSNHVAAKKIASARAQCCCKMKGCSRHSIWRSDS